MSATTSPLTHDDEDQLDACRAWVERQSVPVLLQPVPEQAVDPSDSVAGRLALVRALLEQAKPTWEDDKTVAMGVVLGDALAEYLQMEWCVVEDEHGRARAIQKPGEPIQLFPESMIAKRHRAGERVDVFELFSGIVAQVEAYRQQQQAQQ